MRLFRLLYAVGLILTMLVITACQPSVDPAPDLSPEAPEVTEAVEEATPTVALSPTPEDTATPAPILGRFATDPTQIGYLRVVHVAPDAGPVDVYVDSSPMVSGLEYGLASGRTNIIHGSYTVSIVERGSQPPSGGQMPADALVSFPVDLTIGRSLLLVLMDTADGLRLNAFEESNEPLNTGMSRVSVIHAVQSAPDVTVRDAEADTEDASPLGSIAFGERSATVEIPSAETVLDFVLDDNTAFSYPFNPLPNIDYILVFYGRSPAPEQLGVLLYDHPVPGRAEVRAINASTIDQSLDIYLNGELFAPNVGVNSAGERRTIPDGSYRVEIYPAGADPQAEDAANTRLIQSQISLLPDTAQALIVVGGEAALRVTSFSEDLSPMPRNTARIAYINALETVSAAQIGNDSTVREDLGTVGFGQGSPYASTHVGPNAIFWASEEGVLEETRLEAEAGYNYLYFLTGNVTPFILSEMIGIDEALGDVVEDDSGMLSTPIPATRIRVINVNEEGIAIDFMAEGKPLASDLEFGQSSEFLEVETGIFPIVVRQSGSEEILVDHDLRLGSGTEFTFILYGNPEYLELLSVRDAAEVGGSSETTVRFINSSGDETVPLGLIVTQPSTPPQGNTGGQSSVPINSRWLFEIQYPLTASPTVPMPLSPVDFIISDNRSNLIGTRIYNVSLEEGSHYDIVAIYIRQFDGIQAVVVPHPER